MKDIIYVVLFVSTLQKSDAIKCRGCYNATFLDDCTTTITCNADHKCYTKALLTSGQDILYNAGCSHNSICAYVSSAAIGRRDHLVACNKCCDIGDYCNNNLCGLKSNPNATTTITPSTSSSSLSASSSTIKSTITTTGNPTTPGPGSCFNCNNKTIGRVTDPRLCRKVTKCAPDEMCTAEDFIDGGTRTYSFGCMNSDVCKLLTKFAIEDRFRCQDPQLQAAGFCNRKRSSDVSTCKVCCAGALCNLDTCEKLLDNMFYLWKNGVFDLSTLQQNGTLTSTSTLNPNV